MTTATGERRPRPGRRFGLGQAQGALAALALLVLLDLLFVPHFATAANLWNLLLDVSATVLVAVGMTLVMASGGIDLSVGSVMAVASAVAALLLDRGAGVALLGGLGAALGLGLVNGTLVALGRIQPFIVTLALMLAGRGLAFVLSNEGQLLPFQNAAFEYLGRGYLGPVPVPAALAAAVAGVAAFVVRATVFGRYLLAVGGNEPAARLAGANVERTRLVVYLACGGLAGLAGLIETARLGATDAANIGSGMEFAAIAAAVVGGNSFAGGRASVGGTVLGALLMAVLAASCNMLLVPYAWALVVQAGIILLAVALQRPRLV
jgi:ribose/xylose/arabinose/galactoside ABC-type transport system permease subunit